MNFVRTGSTSFFCYKVKELVSLRPSIRSRGAVLLFEDASLVAPTGSTNQAPGWSREILGKQAL